MKNNRKYTILLLVLLVFFIAELSAQDRAENSSIETIFNDSIVSLNFEKIFPWGQHKRPVGIDIPLAFSIGCYAFYPDKKIIGVHSFWIHPLSSVGFREAYVRLLENTDYDTFEVLDVDKQVCKDKNNIYINGESIGISPLNAHIITNDSYLKVIKQDSIYLRSLGSGKFNVYSVDEIIGDIAFRRNDSLFIYNQDGYFFSPEEFDIYSLKQIDTYLYQDSKNLYRMHNNGIETIEGEQITERKIFHAYEKEQRSHEKYKNYFLIGRKNFYRRDGRLFYFKLQSYHFIEDSYYYFYNDKLLFYDYFNSTISHDFSKFKDGSNFEGVQLRDIKKTRPLGKDMLAYDNKELFYEEETIAYPNYMNIDELEYIGHFPYRLYVDLIPERKFANCKNNSPVLRYKNKSYIICEDSLVVLKKIDGEYRNNDYKGFNLNNLHFYNEYYFTDGQKLYCNDEIKAQIKQNSGGRYLKNIPYFSKKDIDLKRARFFDRYFTDGSRLYYSYMLVGYKQISHKDNNDIFEEGNKKKEINKNTGLSFIRFDKLKLIEGTEYLTDENYLIYKTLIVGKIDHKTLKVYNNYFLEDSTRYFYEGSSIEKNVLKIKVHK